MKVYEVRFPIVRYFHLPPSPIYRDKLRRADIGAVLWGEGGGLFFISQITSGIHSASLWKRPRCGMRFSQSDDV